MELDMECVGKRIAKRRIKVKMTQTKLAERIGVSNNHLSSVERGRSYPSVKTLIEICEVLKVTPDYLFLGTMHSSALSTDLLQKLQLCAPEDIPILSQIIEVFVEKNSDKWNSDNSF